MAKRFYSLDDSLNLDWVDLDTESPKVGGLSGHIYFEPVSAKDGYTDFRFWKTWLFSEDPKNGVWHETPQGVAKQLRAKARAIQKIPVHPF